MRGGRPSRHVPSYFAEQHEDQRHQPGNLGQVHAEQLVCLGPHVEIDDRDAYSKESRSVTTVIRNG